MDTHLITFYSLFNSVFFFNFFLIFILYQYCMQSQAIPCFSIYGSQQVLGFHTAFGFLILILLLLTLLQVKYQNFGNPFQTQGANLVAFYHGRACLCYSIGRDKPTKFYLPMLDVCVSFLELLLVTW